MDSGKQKIWSQLAAHSKQIAALSMQEQFRAAPERFTQFSLEAAGLFLDYAKNRITPTTIELLVQLAAAAELETYRAKLFNGEPINVTEKRAVLHSALRNPGEKPAAPMQAIKKELSRIAKCVTALRSAYWTSYSGEAITDIVHIGIGGSELGPHMVVSALQPYQGALKLHFVSNIDATHISETLKQLNPYTTLFIVASKTFTTQETLTNAITAKDWLLNNIVSNPAVIKNHFIAVTAYPERAVDFGIDPANIFPFWEWVGGRFSLWSAIGLAIAIAIGMDNFSELLAGAHAMDTHFQTAPLAQNMPVLLALLGIWNINFLGATTQAVLPYEQYLHLFPAYLQQLEMESNGKRVDRAGVPLSYKTAPVVWGAVETNGQHAFHQLLMQGTQMVPVDFIISCKSHNPIRNHQQLLYANCLAQSRALMCGRTAEEAIEELQEEGMELAAARALAPHKVIPGNIPSNTIVLPKLTPHSLGALVALYEHKVFVQGIIWEINSFDQWGVELGKKLTNYLAPRLGEQASKPDLDSSTQGLITLYQRGTS